MNKRDLINAYLNSVGRIRGDSAGSGSCLLAFGRENAYTLRTCGLEGVYVPLDGAGKTVKETLF